MSLKNLAKLINNATKEKTIEDEFLNALIQSIERSDKPRRPSKTFKPSSLGGCLRKVYFEVTGAETDESNPPSYTLIGISESGTDRHERIQNAIKSLYLTGFDIVWVDVRDYVERHKEFFEQIGTEIVEQMGNETKMFNRNLNLSFLCDGIVKMRGEYYILEIKTETSFKWANRSEPEDAHKTQACCYSLAFGIDKVLFIYENRDVCSKKAFCFQITDEERATRVVDRIETVNNHIGENTVPDKTKNERECNYCLYKKECQKW